MPGHVAHAELTARASTESYAFDFDEVGSATLHKRNIPALIKVKQKLVICSSERDIRSIGGEKCDKLGNKGTGMHIINKEEIN